MDNNTLSLIQAQALLKSTNANTGGYLTVTDKAELLTAIDHVPPRQQAYLSQSGHMFDIKYNTDGTVFIHAVRQFAPCAHLNTRALRLEVGESVVYASI